MRLFSSPPTINIIQHHCSTKPLSFRFRPRSSMVAHHRRKDKMVVIMGATGTGKSRLSIDLASVFPAEVVNSDKIQVYSGLDVTTNKIPARDRRNVPHHLLGLFHGQISAAEYRSAADAAVAGITSRRNLPLLVGGSNSLIHALLTGHSNIDVFNDHDHRIISCDLRYQCCFLWVDVSPPVLDEYVERRVDDMLGSGMFEELAGFYSSGRKGPESIGLRKAIGVPEFDKYFRKCPPGTERDEEAYGEAVREIKENTRRLVERQLGKIRRLRDAGWDLQRIDATEAFVAVMEEESDQERWSEIWEARVLNPSVKIVKRFLEEDQY